MRHRKSGAKLGRTSSHRKAMFRNMVTSLFKYDRIQTTDVKAKELRGWADHIITLAKRGDLHARRQALSIVREKDVVHKLFNEASKRYGNISGGYTRIIKLGRRPGDSAPVSLIELVEAGKRKVKTSPAPKKKEVVASETKKPEIKPEAKADPETSAPAESKESIESQDLKEKKVDVDDTK
jgi:large subunit ribosomal protein L17